MLRDLLSGAGSVDHPFMKTGLAGAPKGVIVMSADKGLCGAFNGNLVRAADLFQRENANVVWYPVGNKARNRVRRLPQPTAQAWSLSQAEKLETARAVAAKVADEFVAGKIGEIVLVSPKLISTMLQRPEVRTIVPIPRKPHHIDGMRMSITRRIDPAGPKGAVEFAPSPEGRVDALVAEVSGVHVVLGDVGNGRRVFLRPVSGDEQRHGERRKIDRRVDDRHE